MGEPSLRVRFGVFVLALVAFGCAADGSGGQSTSPVVVPTSTVAAPTAIAGATDPAATPTAVPSLAGWYPAGFAVSPLDPTIAYRWMSKSQFRCDPAPVCWGLQVLARDGCAADLTIELAIADGAGGALGTVFDTAGIVRAGQQATMVFEAEMSGAQKAAITKVSCT